MTALNIKVFFGSQDHTKDDILKPYVVESADFAYHA
jgi:hypothetical protein